MGQTFKAAVAMPNGTIEIQNFQTPDPKPDAGLLKVAVTGVCGSDWMFFQDFPKIQGPAILGHETVGYVQEVGAIAGPKWGVKEGDLVAL